MPFVRKETVAKAEAMGNGQIEALVAAAKAIGQLPEAEGQCRGKEDKPQQRQGAGIRFSGS